MQIKPSTDYALRMLVYLATNETIATSKEISQQLGIPQKNILNIGRTLKMVNYVNIINGPYGGYIIAKVPEDITLCEVISLFESVAINCCTVPKGHQPIVDAAMDTLYSELQEIIEDKLKSMTLATIIAKST